MTFSIQDRELVSIIGDLQNSNFTCHSDSTETSRLKFQNTAFNLSNNV